MKISVMLILAGALYLSASCNKKDDRCVDQKVDAFKENEACDNGASVKVYIFQDELVYVYDPGSCGADLATEVTDNKCNTLGYLGGISGNTEINGEAFYANAELERTVFEN